MVCEAAKVARMGRTAVYKRAHEDPEFVRAGDA
jgi:hypothetical protein